MTVGMGTGTSNSVGSRAVYYRVPHCCKLFVSVCCAYPLLLFIHHLYREFIVSFKHRAARVQVEGGDALGRNGHTPALHAHCPVVVSFPQHSASANTMRDTARLRESARVRVSLCPRSRGLQSCWHYASTFHCADDGPFLTSYGVLLIPRYVSHSPLQPASPLAAILHSL